LTVFIAIGKRTYEKYYIDLNKINKLSYQSNVSNKANMSLMKPGSDNKSRRDIRQIGLYTAVPGLLLAGPLIGYGIGWWFDGKFGTSPYLSALGVLLGIAAAGIEIYGLVKKASSSENNSDNDTEPRT